MATNKTIDCVINKGLIIRLENCVEVMGHDDSLPFNADVFVYDAKDETGCFQKIATAYNNGWGGITEIDTIHERYSSKLGAIDKFLCQNYEIVCDNGIRWDVTLEYLISSMAAYCIDGNMRKIAVTSLIDCKKKKKC